jgi:hypothetical protein
MPVTDEQLNSKPRKARAKAITGDRVQATSALAVANQAVVGEMQAILRTAVEAQLQSGAQAAEIAHRVQTGELAWGAFQHKLAELRQEQPRFTPTFQTLDVAAILPSADEMAATVIGAIDWARLDAVASEALPASNEIDGL